MFERACAAAGFEPQIAHETEDMLIAQALVAAGLGLALLPRLTLSVMHPEITLRELPDPPLRHVFAARIKGRRVPAAAAMLNALLDVSRHSPSRSAGARRPGRRARRSPGGRGTQRGHTTQRTRPGH
jgi:DNA-binding transcriptional LysR family regulator